MAEEDQDQKTEEPTGKRLDEAREHGQLPVSKEMTSLAQFLGILIVVAWLAPPMAKKLTGFLTVFLASPHALHLDDQALQTLILNTLLQTALATCLIFIVLLAAAVLGVMLQTGLFFALELITPDLTRLSPLNGLRRMFSVNALVELGKSFGKMVVIGLMVFTILWPVINKIPHLTGLPLLSFLSVLHKEAIHLIIMLLLVFAAIAIADLVYQRFQYIKNLRMTKAEVKDEYRQQEGDPLIKQRLRQIRLEKARKRMMAQVPKADVIVTNPSHYAIAMQYDNRKMTAPLVIAKGIDQVALRIRDVGLEYKIPIISNPPLARTLYDTVEIDKEIPTQHYRAVAEIISFVYKLKKKKM